MGFEDKQVSVLKEARSAGRMTQRHLAEAAKVSVKTVMRAEHGKPISDENMRALCAVLSLDISDLPLRPHPKSGAAASDESEMGTEAAPVPPAPHRAEAAAAQPSTSRHGSAGRSRWAALRTWPSAPRAAAVRQELSRAATMAANQVRQARTQVTSRAMGACALTFLGGLWLGHMHGLRYGLTMTTLEPTGSASDETKGHWFQPAQAGEAHHHDGDVDTWLADSMSRAYSLDFSNYRREMEDNSSRFTVAGWRGFKKALDDSGLIDAIVSKKLVATAVPTSSPVVLDEGFIEGRYAWKLQMPLLVTFQSSTGNQTQNLMVDAVVVEQNDGARTLGVAQVIVQ